MVMMGIQSLIPRVVVFSILALRPLVGNEGMKLYIFLMGMHSLIPGIRRLWPSGIIK